MPEIKVTIPEGLRNAVTLNIQAGVPSYVPEAKPDRIGELKKALVDKLDANEKSRRKGNVIPMVI